MLQLVARPEAPPCPDPATARVSCIQSLEELESIGPQWRALLQRAGTFTPFQTFEWHASWWRIFGDDFALFLLCAEDEDGQLIGLAPLMLAQRSMPGRSRRVVPGPDGGQALADAEAARRLLGRWYGRIWY